MLKSAVGPLADIVVATCDVCFFSANDPKQTCIPGKIDNALGASDQSYCFWCFLYPKSKSPTFAYSSANEMYPRAVGLRLYISNVIQVYIYFFIFNIS